MAKAPVADFQSRKTLSECNRYMLENEICCDVAFLVGDNQKQILAHKYVLVSRSSVFHAMFCDLLAKQRDEIVIPDVPEEAFSTLLWYIYCEEAELAPESVLGALYAAKKYAIGGLEDQIIKWLDDNITTQSVCMILSQTALYGDILLEEKCLRFVDANLDVLSSGLVRDLTKDSLLKVLSRDSIEVGEAMVFEAVLDWSYAECSRRGLVPDRSSQRDVIGDALYLVRFPLLSNEYFARGVVDLGILNPTECTEIFQLINGVTQTCPKFSSKPRSSAILKVSRFARNDADDELAYNFSNRSGTDSIMIWCDKPILLRGVSLYGTRCGSGTHTVDLQILKENNVVGQTLGDFQASKGELTYSVLLPYAVPIKAHNSVMISAHIRGTSSCQGYGTNGIVKAHGHTFTFETMYGSIQKQISEILFSRYHV